MVGTTRRITKVSEKDFAGFSSFSDEKLLAALDSESYEPAYYVSGHLARELIYDEIRVRGLRNRRAKLLALFGLYREPRDSHALSACQSCLETICDVPAHVKESIYHTEQQYKAITQLINRSRAKKYPPPKMK
jgi:hypothetical protein